MGKHEWVVVKCIMTYQLIHLVESIFYCKNVVFKFRISMLFFKIIRNIFYKIMSFLILNASIYEQ